MNIGADQTSAVSFDALDGWANDDHQLALQVFLRTAHLLDDRGHLAQKAHSALDEGQARAFFETYFEPRLCGDQQTCLMTAYYEPELEGSLMPSPSYPVPILAAPEHPERFDRQAIEGAYALQDQGLEIAWLKDWVDLYVLQIQGSGLLRLPSGERVAIRYAADNGRAYVSIGQVLIERGVFTAQNISAEGVTAWLRANLDEARALTWRNPRYIFFALDADCSQLENSALSGPIGTAGVPLTGGRSLAVDLDFTPLGTPVWTERAGDASTGDASSGHLRIAQDTGGAIKGPQRGDLYMGSGPKAALAASSVKDGGRFIRFDLKRPL